MERKVKKFDYSLWRMEKSPVMHMTAEGESFHLHHRRVDMQRRWKISHPKSQKLTTVSVTPIYILHAIQTK